MRLEVRKYPFIIICRPIGKNVGEGLSPYSLSSGPDGVIIRMFISVEGTERTNQQFGKFYFQSYNVAVFMLKIHNIPKVTNGPLWTLYLTQQMYTSPKKKKKNSRR